MYRPAGGVPRRHDPRRSRNSDDIFGRDHPADVLDLAVRIATGSADGTCAEHVGGEQQHEQQPESHEPTPSFDASTGTERKYYLHRWAETVYSARQVAKHRVE